MGMIDLLGYVAAVLTTAAFIPQVWRAWKTRSVRDLSLPMYLLMVTGLVLWLVYGFLIGSWPLVAANLVTLVFSGSILLMRIFWR